MYIWPEKLGMGAVLFLTSRYITVLRLPFEIVREYSPDRGPYRRVEPSAY